MKRLLVPGAGEGHARVTGPRAHYLRHVLRVVPGEALEVFDGSGTSFEARVETSDEAGVTLVLGAASRTPALRVVTVLQGLPKGDKLELVLQKGTELGASAFVPVACERSVVKLEGKEEAKQGRWQRIVEEAARQCGRADVPTVARAVGLLEGVRGLAAGTQVLVLDESERVVPLSAAFSAVRDGRTPVALVVGPEGGLARAEVEALVALGAVPVTLGRRVLRTETAALAALVVLRHLDGELG
jgi:16S rRNA (uracil1498-N3)-methyltransferase